MGKDSNIEWTDATWNPWMGCTKVSEGCAGCYMFREQVRYGHDPNEIRRSKTTFGDPLKWKDSKIVFVCSWSDFFHEDVPDDWRAEAWKIMAITPQHTYLLLTKRPENALTSRMFPEFWQSNYDSLYSHVWLGVSVELQKYVHRIQTIMHIPTTRYFVSAEPLLGPLDLKRYLKNTKLNPLEESIMGRHDKRLSWVVTGGESGPKRRPFDLDWARQLRDECASASVPFFMKQVDKVLPIPEDLMIRQFPEPLPLEITR